MNDLKRRKKLYQKFNDRFVKTFDNTRPPLGEDFLGVEFVTPVDTYLQTDRSIKYAFLIIILTFLIVFFSEIRLQLNLNSFAYLLVGLAVVMFYSLELSLTEHLSFDLSYGAACVLTLGIIIGFVYRLIKSIAFSLFMLFMIGIGYGFIYIILQMESYSLLVGTLGVFAILSIIMLITSSKSMRNVLVKAQTKINTDLHSL